MIQTSGIKSGRNFRINSEGKMFFIAVEMEEYSLCLYFVLGYI